MCTPLVVRTMVVLPDSSAEWTIFVQTVKIVKKFCVVLYIVADKNLYEYLQWCPDFVWLEHVSNSRYRLGFALNGTMNSWRVLTPLNVVCHCPHPFRWAYFCPSLHTMQQRTIPWMKTIKPKQNVLNSSKLSTNSRF